MAKPKSPTPENIADDLTARERVILFCAAMNIDHVAVGILASAMQSMEIRGLIERDQKHLAVCAHGYRPRRVSRPAQTGGLLDLGCGMCGRFIQRYTWREIADLYGLTGAARICRPTTTLPRPTR